MFVLKRAKNADKKIIDDLLNQWQLKGLSQTKSQSKHWHENPFIRQNGFGEVRINDRFHQDFSPEKLGLKGGYL